jgi:NAD(P)-dependent dehydrogenase (short-subunit alcohol dehydrogenase family)
MCGVIGAHERAADSAFALVRVAALSSTSRLADLGPTGSSIAFAVSKASLIQLTRCMAVAFAPETFVNGVASGLLQGTRAISNLSPEQVERSAASSLLKKAADKERLRQQGGSHALHRNHGRPDCSH